MQAILNKSTNFLSAGTRVEILEAPDWLAPYDEQDDDCMIDVMLRTKPSFKLREQGFPADGIFEIEKQYLTPIRPRVDYIVYE